MLLKRTEEEQEVGHSSCSGCCCCGLGLSVCQDGWMVEWMDGGYIVANDECVLLMLSLYSVGTV